MYNVLCCSILECGQAWTKPCSCCEQRIGTLGSLSHRTHPAWGPYFTGNYHCNFTSFLNWLLMPFINSLLYSTFQTFLPFIYTYKLFKDPLLSDTHTFQKSFFLPNQTPLPFRYFYLSDYPYLSDTPAFQIPIPFKYTFSLRVRVCLF